MKKRGTQKISLEKLTIARLSKSSLKKIDGGTSGLTVSDTEAIDAYNICYQVH